MTSLPLLQFSAPLASTTLLFLICLPMSQVPSAQILQGLLKESIFLPPSLWQAHLLNTCYVFGTMLCSRSLFFRIFSSKKGAEQQYTNYCNTEWLLCAEVTQKSASVFSSRWREGMGKGSQMRSSKFTRQMSGPWAKALRCDISTECPQNDKYSNPVPNTGPYLMQKYGQWKNKMGQSERAKGKTISGVTICILTPSYIRRLPDNNTDFKRVCIKKNWL